MILLILSLVLPKVAASTESQKLIILSPHWEGIRQEYARGFKSWYEQKYGATVEVEWLDQGGTSECLRFLYAQYLNTPAGIGVDLFFGGGTDPYLELKKRDLLEEFHPDPEILRRIPAELNGVPLYDPDFFWFGTHLSTFGILVNRWVVEKMGLPSPKSWEDLADPKLFGWVGMGDPRTSGTMHMMFELMLQSCGWERGFDVVTRFCGNVRRFTRHSAQTAKEAAMGEVACALALDSYAWSEIDEAGKDRLEFVIPQGKSLVNADSIAILKGAPHLQLAQRFIEYVLSPEGQRLAMFPVGAPGGPKEYNLYKMSVDPEIYRSPLCRVQYNPFLEKGGTAFHYDFEKGARRWDLVNRLLAALFLDPHPLLQEAWKELILERPGDEKLKDFGSAPITEEKAAALAQGEWKNPVAREKWAREWAGFARSKYKQIIERP